MKNKTVLIGEEAGAVTFVITDENGKEKRFHHDQEDTYEHLIKMFKDLGIEATYEEWY